jgi:hypothetical protein
LIGRNAPNLVADRCVIQFPWPSSLLVHLVAWWNDGFARAWDSLKSLDLPFLRLQRARR